MTTAVVLQSTLLLLAAWAATAAMRNRSAAERHTVWVATFGTLLLLPLGQWAPTSVVNSTTFSAAVTTARLTARTVTHDADWLASIWVGGMLLLLARIVVSGIEILRITRSARPARFNAPYPVLYSSLLTGPAAWGLGRKMMLLPEGAEQWDDERRAVVVSHEAAHLRRNDCWALAIAELSCAFYWYNPLVWIATSRLRAEQEHAADDEVIRNGADPVSYAGHLVALATTTRVPALAAGAVIRSQLGSRIQAILDPRRLRSMPTRTMILATALTLVAVALPLASMQAERKVEKIGADVSAPRPVYKQEPEYTQEARDAKIEGTVVLSVIIETNGKIYDAKVTRGLDQGLDTNAITAVRSWVFEPAKKGGQAVAVAANIEVNFRLL